MIQDRRTPDPGGPPIAQRLDSWKTIAAYLQRDVSTVQRWERTEGLPVHRHMHKHRGTVFAYPDELDAWVAARAWMGAAAPSQTSRTGWLSWPGAAVAAAILVATTGWVWTASWQRPALQFSEGDWVLITTFENRTGDPGLDGTLAFALARELDDSRFVNVVPRDRVEDVLGLMQLAEDTPVDQTIGREISLQDDGIRALVAGRVDRAGSTYVLSVAILEPATGDQVARLVQEAPAQGEIAPTVRRLAVDVRRELGEAIGSPDDVPAVRAELAIPSLLALGLYSEADAAIASGEHVRAESLLRRAIDEDPGFAAAYTHLAFALRNQQRQPQLYLPLAQRAVDLADAVSDRERYFILGSNHALAGRLDEAIASYEALVELHPDHYWAVNNLAALYQRVGEHARATDYYARLADLRPHDFRANLLAAHQLIQLGNGFALARVYAERARQIATATPSLVVEEWQRRWLRLFPVYERWMANDAQGALDTLAAIVQDVPRTNAPGQEWADVGRAFALLGRLEDAEDILQRLTLEPLGQKLRASVGWMRGDPLITAEAPLLAHAMYFSRSDAAERLASLPTPPPPPQEYLPPFLAGQIQLDQGDFDAAIESFENALQSLGTDGPGPLFVLEELARAWWRSGDMERAMEVLDEASSLRGQLYVGHFGPLMIWLHLEADRARLARALGLDAKASAIEAQLEQLLAVADEDYELAEVLRERSRSVEPRFIQANTTVLAEP